MESATVVFPEGLTLEVQQITLNATTVVLGVRGDKIWAYRDYLAVGFQLGQ